MRSDTRDGFGKLVSQAVAVPLQRLVVDLCCSVLLWSSTPSRDSHDPLGQGQNTCAQARSHPGVRRRDKTLRERPHCLLLLVLETPRGPPCPVCCHQLSPAPAVPVQTHLPSLGTASAGRGWHRPAWGTPLPTAFFVLMGTPQWRAGRKCGVSQGWGEGDPDTKRSQALP